MEVVDTAQINSFGIPPKTNFVSPSEEAVFILTASQLQAIISQAIQPLQDDVSQLRATVERQDEKIVALQATATLQEENSLIQLRLINDLREAAKPREITKTQENRIKILRALLAARGGKMLTKDARQIMKMDKGAFSRLVDAMGEYVETKKYSLNKRQTVLILKPRSIVVDNDQRLTLD